MSADSVVETSPTSLREVPTRRKFMTATMTVLAAASVTPAFALSANNRRVENIGIQLYTLRNAMQNDMAGTLAKVAELGYTEMEFAGYFGNSARDVSRMLASNGLSSPASHVGINLLREDMMGQLDYAAELGQKYIIIPAVGGNEREAHHYYQHAEFLMRLGEECKTRGMVAAYHNHDFEFQTPGDELGMDILLNNTDPALVSFELDLFWAVHAGVNPIDYFKMHPGRFAAVHVKDRTANGDMVDVGEGVIDFEEIFSFIEVAGIKHFFVENDQPRDEFNSVAYSINTVQQYRF